MHIYNFYHRISTTICSEYTNDYSKWISKGGVRVKNTSNYTLWNKKWRSSLRLARLSTEFNVTIGHLSPYRCCSRGNQLKKKIILVMKMLVILERFLPLCRQFEELRQERHFLEGIEASNCLPTLLIVNPKTQLEFIHQHSNAVIPPKVHRLIWSECNLISADAMDTENYQWSNACASNLLSRWSDAVHTFEVMSSTLHFLQCHRNLGDV